VPSIVQRAAVKPALLGELPPGRRRDLLARLIEGARGDLPQLATRYVAELANQDDPAIRVPGDNPDRTRVPDDLPRGEVTVRQSHLVPVHPEQFAGIDFLALDPFLHMRIIMAA
jgi:hypothetical protein